MSKSVDTPSIQGARTGGRPISGAAKERMEKPKAHPKNRIQSACKELEEALNNFENESGEEIRLERQRRLNEIKNQLVEIKSQLEELS